MCQRKSWYGLGFNKFNPSAISSNFVAHHPEMSDKIINRELISIIRQATCADIGNIAHTAIRQIALLH
jgi:hypothetical protein